MRGLQFWLTKLFAPLRKVLAPLFGPKRSSKGSGFFLIFQQIGKMLAAMFFGVIRWWSGMNFRLLLQGFPALVFGLGSLTVLAYAAFTPAHEIEARYRERARNTKDPLE